MLSLPEEKQTLSGRSEQQDYKVSIFPYHKSTVMVTNDASQGDGHDNDDNICGSNGCSVVAGQKW